MLELETILSSFKDNQFCEFVNPKSLAVGDFCRGLEDWSSNSGEEADSYILQLPCVRDPIHLFTTILGNAKRKSGIRSRKSKTRFAKPVLCFLRNL